MWTVNDLPTYGMASGWSTTNIMGRPLFMNDTQAFHLQHDRKSCYFDCHKLFFPKDHPYRMNKKAFTKNRVEYKVARLRSTRELIRDCVVNFSPAVEQPLALPSGYGSNHKWTKKKHLLGSSILCNASDST
ncbi:UNVERIFIED_CONTAM: hypothetical protein Sradi_1771900 [Sesamum radiatum]|uniref:Uncharacterized protein n=1 Tax=Sesamum radiatum TaxID=300843 RepID=A0AAW2TV70_SESRA